MSVRKRTWITSRGETRTAFIADVIDQHGRRSIKTFKLRREAEEFADAAGVSIRAGTFTAASRSPTVKQAAEDWLQAVALRGRERTTINQYRQHVALHIVPRIGKLKLAKLTTPKVHEFVDALMQDLGSKRPTMRKVLVSLKSLLRDAMRRGHVAQNVAVGVRVETDKRSQKKLAVGIDIPTGDEVRRIINAASGQLRVLLIVAIGTGLRASELRGLRWDDVDLKAGELHVRQRADAYRAIGAPKSHSSRRTIPLGPMLVNTLREWKLACPGDLVFPSPRGGIEHHKSIVRAVDAVMTAANVVAADGMPKYSGLHAFRHFYASWCINRKADGGLELPAKIVQARLGHGSIVMTLDRYGHLFPNGDDGGELAAAEKALFG
jgi:integrase